MCASISVSTCRRNVFCVRCGRRLYLTCILVLQELFLACPSCDIFTFNLADLLLSFYTLRSHRFVEQRFNSQILRHIFTNFISDCYRYQKFVLYNLLRSIIKGTLENHLRPILSCAIDSRIFGFSHIHSQNAKLVQIEFRANVQYFCQYTAELAKFEMNELPGVRINISHCFENWNKDILKRKIYVKLPSFYDNFSEINQWKPFARRTHF